MSVVAALSAPWLVQTVVGFSGRLPQEFESVVASPSELRLTQFWLGHGVNDRTLPIDLGRAMRDTLRQFGVRSIFTEFAAGHQVTPAMLSDAHAWLTKVLDGAEVERLFVART